MADELPPPEGRPAELPPPDDESLPAPAGQSWGRPRRGLPSWKVLAAAGAAVVVVGGGLAVAAGGGGGGGGGCTKGLLAHFERSEDLGTYVVATDLEAARDHGYRDGDSLEDLGSSQRQTGTYPGLLASRFRFERLFDSEEFTARTGVEPQDVKCSVGNFVFEVSSGSFDPPEVAGSAVGDDGVLAATDDVLAMAGGPVDNPARLLEPIEAGSLANDDDVVAAVDRLLEAGAYSYVVQWADDDVADDGPLVAGAGVAEAEDGDNDQRALWVVWVFADDDAATAGRPAMARHLAEAYSGIVSIDADGLAADGRLVSGSFPIREAERWYDPMRDNDSRGLLPRTG